MNACSHSLIQLNIMTQLQSVLSAAAVSWLLASEWLPLGVENSLILNFLFIIFIIALVLGTFKVFIKFYPQILQWCLDNKKHFLQFLFS
jgi:copper/silver efflux system protein